MIKLQKTQISKQVTKYGYFVSKLPKAHLENYGENGSVLIT